MPCSLLVALGTWRISKDGALTRRRRNNGERQRSPSEGKRVLMVVAWRWG